MGQSAGAFRTPGTGVRRADTPSTSEPRHVARLCGALIAARVRACRIGRLPRVRAGRRALRLREWTRCAVRPRGSREHADAPPRTPSASS